MDTDGPKILVVMPDLAQAELIERELRSAELRCTVKRAANRDGYQRMFDDFAPQIVISAMVMQRYEALQLMPSALEKYPSARWILISDRPGEEEAASARNAGAADYLGVNEINRLGAAIRRVLGGGEETEKAPVVPEEAPPEAPRADVPPPRTPPDAVPPVTADADLFREIVEFSDDLIAMLDASGKRLYNNPAFKNVLDDPSELRGTDSFVDIHPADRDRVREVFQKSMATGIGQRTEYRLMDEQGNVRLIESQGSMVPGAEGKPVRMAVISRDVTARRRAEESLQNLVAGTSAVTGEKFFVALVRHLARSLGVRFALVSETVSGLRERVRSIAYWADDRWVPPFEYDVKGTTCERVIKEGRFCFYPENVQGLFPQMDALKTMHAVSYMGIPLFGASEVPVGHLFIMDDKPLVDPARTKYIISIFAARTVVELERMRLLKSVGEKEVRFHAALEAVHEAVVITDLNDIILFTNRPLQEMSGYTQKEMAGKILFSLLLPEDQWLESQLRSEQRAQGVSEEYETTLKKKDGTMFPARIHASPIRNEKGDAVGIVGVIQDLSPRNPG